MKDDDKALFSRDAILDVGKGIREVSVEEGVYRVQYAPEALWPELKSRLGLDEMMARMLGDIPGTQAADEAHTDSPSPSEVEQVESAWATFCESFRRPT